MFWFKVKGNSPNCIKLQICDVLGNYKLIKFYETNKLHLFDPNKDMGEKNDLADRKSEVVAKLHDRLNEYLTSVYAQMPSPIRITIRVGQSVGEGGEIIGEGEIRDDFVFVRSTENRSENTHLFLHNCNA